MPTKIKTKRKNSRKNNRKTKKNKVTLESQKKLVLKTILIFKPIIL